LKAGALLALFLSFDVPFLLANLFKFFEGGYVPMLIGAALIARMLIWSHGRTSLLETYASRFSTFDKARPLIDRLLTTRVPGIGVFLSPSAENVPPILVHHVARGRSLHETAVMLTVERPPVPVVAEDARWRLTPLGDGFYRLVIAFGYMEEPRLLPVLHEAAKATGLPLDSTDTTFYVGYETVIVQDEWRINRIPEAIFSYFNRNAVRDEEHYGMPCDQVVEIGAQLRV
jgi:KUP system potassium uptake protein